MYTVLLTLSSSLFLSGTIGYVSYAILKETGGLYFSEREKEDKKSFVTLLSLITFSVLYVFYFICTKILENTIEIYFFSFILTVISMAIIDFYILPKAIHFLKDSANRSREQQNLAKYLKTSKRKKFFNGEDSKVVFLFKLDGTYITSGYLVSTTPESDMYQEYVLESSDGPSIRTIKEIEDTYTENSFDIFVDVENDIQVYAYNSKI